ncbi:MAG: phosphoribosylglycinamide formyltransferase [Alphaproteobacteria bacterium]|nr:phosphoribosylglycinamide formyltransferase [Alphaproteobacteria bacterium]
MQYNKKRVAILISGRGSNMQALILAAKKPNYPASINLIISNNSQAKGIEIAKKHQIPIAIIEKATYTNKTLYEKAILAKLQQYNIELICLAGYLSILRAEILAHYENKILNIHPSLLPNFPGLNAPDQALKAAAAITGCTVHLVTAQLDRGPILAQAKVPILKTDDVKSLSARILLQEHKLYPLALAQFIANNSIEQFTSAEPTPIVKMLGQHC